MLGSIIGAAAGLLANKRDNDAARDSAREANAFTTEQLKNRHQWEVEDLRKAGLNPILSAHGTPSIGASAKADVHSSADAISRGAQAALSTQLTKAQIDNLKAQSTNQIAQSHAALATAGLSNQKMKIYSPFEHGAAALGDVTNSASQAFRKHYKDAGDILSGRKKINMPEFGSSIKKLFAR